MFTITDLFMKLKKNHWEKCYTKVINVFLDLKKYWHCTKNIFLQLNKVIKIKISLHKSF